MSINGGEGRKEWRRRRRKNIQTGQYLLNVFNECGQEDGTSVNVAFDCLIITDTIFKGETGDFCFDEILTLVNGCNATTATQIELNGDCLNYLGLSEGSDTICLKVIIDGDTSALQFIITSLLSSASHAQDGSNLLRLYPNPASNEIWVAWQQLDIRAVELNDLTGRQLQYVTLTSNPANIPLSGLPSGTYFFHFLIPREVLTKKVIVLP